MYTEFYQFSGLVSIVSTDRVSINYTTYLDNHTAGIQPEVFVQITLCQPPRLYASLTLDDPVFSLCTSQTSRNMPEYKHKICHINTKHVIQTQNMSYYYTCRYITLCYIILLCYIIINFYELWNKYHNYLRHSTALYFKYMYTYNKRLALGTTDDLHDHLWGPRGRPV